MKQQAIARLSEAVRSVELLVAIAMFLVVIPLHYIEGPDSLFGLERHSLARLFLLLPITYLGFLFGTKAGLTGAALALVIMLPNALSSSEHLADALVETGGIVV